MDVFAQQPYAPSKAGDEPACCKYRRPPNSSCNQLPWQRVTQQDYWILPNIVLQYIFPPKRAPKLNISCVYRSIMLINEPLLTSKSVGICLFIQRPSVTHPPKSAIQSNSPTAPNGTNMEVPMHVSPSKNSISRRLLALGGSARYCNLIADASPQIHHDLLSKSLISY